MKNNNPKIAVIGFGEAAAGLCKGWAQRDVCAYDIKQDSDTKTAKEKLSQMKAAGIVIHASTATAVADADMIFSTVTADQAHIAAKAAAKSIKPGSYFLDLNSCAPSTKLKNSALIHQAGGRYVDVAVMATIAPKHHQTAMLVSGEHAITAMALMHKLDMRPTHAPGPIGRASTIKMIRSVMMKGIEALTAECFTAACKAGVADEVSASLDASQTREGWKAQASYNMERMTTHGIRRAAEMREVAKTLADLNISNKMTASIIDWQECFGSLNLSLRETEGLESRIEAISATLQEKKKLK